MNQNQNMVNMFNQMMRFQMLSNQNNVINSLDSNNYINNNNSLETINCFFTTQTSLKSIIVIKRDKTVEELIKL